MYISSSSNLVHGHKHEVHKNVVGGSSMIRFPLGHWDVVGEDVYLDSDQSDREENEGDEDENNLEELRDHLWNISFSM